MNIFVRSLQFMNILVINYDLALINIGTWNSGIVEGWVMRVALLR